MPGHDRVEATRKRLRIERTAQTHGTRNVVSGVARIKLIEKPQAPLAERKYYVAGGVEQPCACGLLRFPGSRQPTDPLRQRGNAGA